MSAPRIVRDRLYAIELRPQELALYGDQVRFALHYTPMFDDPAEATTTHWKLLVCEITAELPADDQIRRAAGQRLQLLKIGWEIELETDAPQRVGTLAEDPGELRLLLGRVADTVNDLARRGGLEAPLGPAVVARLLAEFRGV